MSQEFTGRLRSEWLQQNLDWYSSVSDLLNASEQTKIPEWVERFFEGAEHAVKALSLVSPNTEENRAGGVLTLISTGENPFIVVRQVGVINSTPAASESFLEQNKDWKYLVYSLGKAAVLLLNPDAISSRYNQTLPSNQQITAEGKAMPAGALRIPGTDYIVSFSGFKLPEDDELVDVFAGILMHGEEKLLTLDTAGKLLSDVGNTRLQFAPSHHIAQPTYKKV